MNKERKQQRLAEVTKTGRSDPTSQPKTFAAKNWEQQPGPLSRKIANCWNVDISNEFVFLTSWASCAFICSIRTRLLLFSRSCNRKIWRPQKQHLLVCLASKATYSRRDTLPWPHFPLEVLQTLGKKWAFPSHPPSPSLYYTVSLFKLLAGDKEQSNFVWGRGWGRFNGVKMEKVKGLPF